MRVSSARVSYKSIIFIYLLMAVLSPSAVRWCIITSRESRVNLIQGVDITGTAHASA